MSNERCPPYFDSGILCDSQIEFLCSERFMHFPMITPFVNKQIAEGGIISYGLSSYGYDVRISDNFKIIPDFIKKSHTAEFVLSSESNSIGIVRKSGPTIIDPTEFDESIFEDYTGSEIIIPPHGFVLGKTIEVINVPRDVQVIALGKSTWARCGLVVGITPLEAGFIGTVTIELSNTTDLPIRVRAGHGICQLLFFKGSSVCKTSYADRKGKYMNQIDVTAPKIIKDT